MTIPEYFTGRFYRTKEAAKILGLSFRTLEKHRTYGTGPRFSKLGGSAFTRSKIFTHGSPVVAVDRPLIKSKELYCLPKGTIPT
jgi:hypothetical protein